MIEHVILVDDSNQPIGMVPKRTVHRELTPLHRGFSIFVFDQNGKLLLQQRSALKRTWPLVWSNSCCGHPQNKESTEQAIRRRLRYELALTDCEMFEVIPDYRYQATFDGIMENEFCPVWVGWTTAQPYPNNVEVAAVRWVDWSEFVDAILDQANPTYDDLSPWCLEEAKLLNDSPRFHELWKERSGLEA